MAHKMTDQDMMDIWGAKTPMHKFIENDDVLGGILKRMYIIPFEQIKLQECYIKNRYDLIRTNKETDEDYVPVHLTDKHICISKVVKTVAEELNSGFLILDGFLHYYNGKYWKKLEESVASDFLALAAEKAGLITFETQQEKNKSNLLKQFVADYICPPSNTTNSEDLKILINLQNGTLEYEDGDFRLRDFKKEDLLRYQLSFEYDPNATCPCFDGFLDEVLLEKAAQDVLFEMIGSCFIPTRRLKLETSMMLYGEGANGKGVIYELVKEILGKEHVTGFSMAALSFDANTRAQLSGKLLNYSSELGGKCSPDTIKKLISGEDVEVKTLYKDVWTMRDYSCKFMFNTNSLPKETEANTAFFRRWIILPFNVTIPKEKRDKRLPEKLKKELPGIFNRVIAGAKRLLENEAFTESKLAEDMLEKYKVRSNTVLQFIKDEGWIPSVPPTNTEHKKSDNPHIELKSLFEKYCEFCEQSHVNCASYRTFIDRIKKSFYVQTGCTNNATWVFCEKKEEEPVYPELENLEDEDNPVKSIINNLNHEKSKSEPV